MSVRSDVLLWAQRTIARKGSPPHVLLEIAVDANGEQVQEAFHKIARTSHPDLHRTGLDGDELELVTSAYAVVAGAYQQMRVACMKTTRIDRIKPDDAAKVGANPVTPPDSRPVAPARTATRGAAQTPPAGARTVQVTSSTEVGPRPRHPSSDPPTTRRPSSEPGVPRQPRASTDSDSPVPVSPSGAAPSVNAQQAMSAKALLYYRKAELCLKRGDLRGAVLQLKLACAADPNSGFLRTALAEVETEMRKSP
jgi:hypothetical protein